VGKESAVVGNYATSLKGWAIKAVENPFY